MEPTVIEPTQSVSSNTDDSLLKNSGFPTEIVAIASLKPHPKNYRLHPPDQIEHLIQSMTEHGVYRNVVIAEDDTILAGHGVVDAATKMGWETIPAIRLPISSESVQALKVMAGDNGLGHLAEQDDRMFTELLKEIRDNDVTGLLGTGYDDNMLAGLLFITRDEDEIKDIDHAAHWVGMPDYEEGQKALQLVISFRTTEDRERFVAEYGIQVGKKESRSWMTWWPYQERNDLASVRFEQMDSGAGYQDDVDAVPDLRYQ